jgi:exosortase
MGYLTRMPLARFSSSIIGRTTWFGVYLAACTVFFSREILQVARLALSSDLYSHVLFIPFLSLGLTLTNRKLILRRVGRSAGIASVVFLAGALVSTLNLNFFSAVANVELLTLKMAGLVCLIWAGFLFFYGARAFREVVFPLLFLVLMIPVPTIVLDKVIAALQVGSAELSFRLFQIVGTPVLRQGMLLTVPGVTIEVAKECSGIRSSLAMLITCLLAGYLMLRTTTPRILLAVAVVPMLILKNAIRIDTLTLLAVHVNPQFLSGDLHRKGGVVFFVLGLLMLLPVLYWLQHSERRRLGAGTKDRQGDHQFLPPIAEA